MSERGKVTEAHRRRRAVVYVRQSTLHQVERNVESAARQYALRDRAVELGWPAESVLVVDEDTGRSGSSTAGRIGFKELVAEVGLGHVGLVLALEVSRLARSSADWHQLLDLCALTGTLIADVDGVYSPADFNDRLLLGLKGTMSEAELHLIRARLDGGLRNKAERGELRLALPVGLDRDEDERITLSCDEQVRHAIERVFTLWRQVGSARQVVMELIDEGQKLPRRSVGQRRIRWARASYGAVHDFLTNPAYAGAFVFGKTRQEKRLDAEGRLRVKVVELPVEQWSVCLPEHHPGYVTWNEYLSTRAKLTANVRPRGQGGGAPGQGNALLQGLVRCGRCGRRMQVAYSGNGGNVPRYLCSVGHIMHHTGRRRDRRGDPRARGPVSDAHRRSAAGARASAIRGRAGGATVRRMRAREPARGPNPGVKARRSARRRRARATHDEHHRAHATGAIDRRRARVARSSRAEPAPAVEREDNNPARSQGAAGHADQRGGGHNRSRTTQGCRGDLLGRRSVQRAAAAREPISGTAPAARGHDRPNPPARSTPPRRADRGDPQPPRSTHRPRPAVHPLPRSRRTVPRRHPSRATTRPQQ
ncbi:MAG: hypothetical protein E6G05_14955 [Actinobacteria bacterium]|nr:MAG: hypothetical protein E6G05_14955 [Actinomycetota bacterium]